MRKKEEIYHFLLYRSIYSENNDIKEIFDKAEEIYLNPERKISEESERSKNLILLEKEFGDKQDLWMHGDFEELLLKYPSFLGQVILGDEIFNYERYGFSSQKSLEESLTSFCISEKHLFSFSGSEDYWRTGNIKNKISLNAHGDLYASQTNVSGKSYAQNTFFGKKEVFEIFKRDAKGSGIYAYQDWSEFLLAALKYAESLGKKKMPEIVNWREVLEKAGGGRGTATSEAIFGTNFDDYELKILIGTPILNEKIDKLKNFPLSIYSRDAFSLPYLSEGKLFYLIENESGNISLEKFSHIYKGKKFSKCLEYCEEDLPYVLTATYKYFARDRRKMVKIMDYFNSK